MLHALLHQPIVEASCTIPRNYPPPRCPCPLSDAKCTNALSLTVPYAARNNLKGKLVPSKATQATPSLLLPRRGG
jgi:hypothetical protein